MVTIEALLLDLENARVVSDNDPEAAHGYADDALLDFINDPRVTEAYKAIHKWYA